MAHEDIKGMDDAELREELGRVNFELGQMRPRAPSKWKIFKYSAGAIIGIVGIALAPPTGGASLALTVGGFGVMVVDGIEMIAEIRGDHETTARIDYLRVRNASIHAELKRRERRRRDTDPDS